MPLYEYVYVSLADHAMSPDELCVLLQQAREHNRAHGITGLLIYRDREFMQLIEGEQAVVERLYEQIEKDGRHQQVHCMWHGPIEARSCRSWAMGFSQPQEATLHALPDGRRVLDEGLFATGRSSAGQRIFQSLREEALRHAS